MRLRPSIHVRGLAAAGLAVVLGATALPTPASAAPTTERISANRAGEPGDAPSDGAAVSADGRYVTFSSSARNLVPQQDPDRPAADLLLRDRGTGTIERISVSSTGEPANSGGFAPAQISPDGRYVVFSSGATNLAPGDTRGMAQIYLRDRATKTTRRISVSSGGAAGNGFSYRPAVSANGRYVAFMSTSTNLVAGDTNARQDIFLRDVRYGTTRLISVARDGRTQGDADSINPIISSNGRYVAFESDATNLLDTATAGNTNAYVKDLRSGVVELVSVSAAGQPLTTSVGAVSMSANGQLVAFASSSQNPDGARVYVRDRSRRTTVVASRNVDGSLNRGFYANASISPDGRYVAFLDGTSGGILIRDLPAGMTFVGGLTSAGTPIDGAQWEPAMSNTGVAFNTLASDVAPGGNEHPYQVYFRQF